MIARFSVGSQDQLYQQHLRICYACRSPGLTPDTLNTPRSKLRESCRQFGLTLKFENHDPDTTVLQFLEEPLILVSRDFVVTSVPFQLKLYSFLETEKQPCRNLLD